MAKRKSKHTHQYVRIYPNAYGVSPIDKTRGVWACALPDCTHYMPHNVANQVWGKLSLCNQCMDIFVLDDENMKMDKPICGQCANPTGIHIPDNFDWERQEAKQMIANKTNRPFDEISETEIDMMVQMRRLHLKNKI